MQLETKVAYDYDGQSVRSIRAATKSYVKDLYRFVLERETASEEELDSWTDYLLNTQDPVDLFLRFVRSIENQNRLAVRAARSEESFPPGHFYSPVNNREEIRTDEARIFGPRTLHDVDMNLDGQITIFNRLKTQIGKMPFCDEKTDDHRYHFSNTSYGFGDAAIYWSMLGVFRPNKIIEVGSGYTSALALDAIDHFRLPTTCTFIDPYPDLLKRVSAPLQDKHAIIADRVQTIDPDLVRSLEANDILFIDSSHVVKTGSDVHFELTELLPRVKRGVIVHFHDVFYPFEYPRAWLIDEKKSWNEVYCLHLFLMYNSEFEILHFNHYFVSAAAHAYEGVPTEILSRIKLNPGGGLWLRRI